MMAIMIERSVNTLSSPTALTSAVMTDVKPFALPPLFDLDLANLACLSCVIRVCKRAAA